MFILYCNLLVSHSNLSLRSSLDLSIYLCASQLLYNILCPPPLRQFLSSFSFFFFCYYYKKTPNTAINSRFFCAVQVWRFLWDELFRG